MELLGEDIYTRRQQARVFATGVVGERAEWLSRTMMNSRGRLTEAIIRDMREQWNTSFGCIAVVKWDRTTSDTSNGGLVVGWVIGVVSRL